MVDCDEAPAEPSTLGTQMTTARDRYGRADGYKRRGAGRLLPGAPGAEGENAPV